MPRCTTHSRQATLLAFVSVAALAVAGCDEGEQVTSYEVPKAEQAEPRGNAPAAAPAGDGAAVEITPAAAGADEPSWTVPAGWRRQAGTRAMRVATFEAGDAGSPVEIAVSVFPGDTGGLLANVNRWRQQVGLDAVTEAGLGEVAQPFETAGFTGHTMHLRGPDMHLLGAAIYEPARDRTWFVKGVAEPDVAERLAPEVEAFARSFGAAAAPGQED